eukprot:TRINITY_DN8799_c0_g1_i1.p1 TRINITY_DN8799_c0_g1~~TRINITY_DN8799_c0_g1_i1.p1  ORF type:complete len:602 (+),score=120.09 TRINITY_DN8799_c0_g1_i1:117-1922(+)
MDRTQNEHIVWVIKHPTYGVEVRDRSFWFNLRNYKQCFVGSEAVDCLVGHGCVQTRGQAVRILHILMKEGLFVSVSGSDVYFTDSNSYLYRFTNADSSVLHVLAHQRDDLMRRIKDSETGFVQKDRTFQLTTVKNCFVASEGIDWFVGHGIVQTRDKAIHLMNVLMQEGLIVGTRRAVPYFNDDGSFYKFAEWSSELPDSKSFVSLTRSGTFQHDFLCGALQSESLFHHILSFVDIPVLRKVALLSREYELLIKKHIQNISTSYFNQRANGVTVRLDDRHQNIIWSALNSNWEHFYLSYPHEVRKVVRFGIPAKLRQRVWRGLLEVDDLVLKNPQVYEYCRDKPNPGIEHTIKKDLGRTFPKHPEFQSLTQKNSGQLRLLHVLKAFANFNHKKGVTYCQGMNFIAGVCVLIMPEEEAFWSLVQVMKNNQFDRIYKRKLPGLMHLIAIFDDQFQKFLPDLCVTFRSVGVAANVFANKWFLTLFGCVFPLELVFRIWDHFVCDGWSIIMQISLAILKLSQDYLTEHPTLEDVFVYFDCLPQEICDQEKLFRVAKTFPIEDEVIVQLHNLSDHIPTIIASSNESTSKDSTGKTDSDSESESDDD